MAALLPFYPRICSFSFFHLRDSRGSFHSRDDVCDENELCELNAGLFSSRMLSRAVSTSTTKGRGTSGDVPSGDVRVMNLRYLPSRDDFVGPPKSTHRNNSTSRSFGLQTPTARRRVYHSKLRLDTPKTGGRPLCSTLLAEQPHLHSSQSKKRQYFTLPSKSDSTEPDTELESDPEKEPGEKEPVNFDIDFETALLREQNGLSRFTGFLNGRLVLESGSRFLRRVSTQKDVDYEAEREIEADAKGKGKSPKGTELALKKVEFNDLSQLFMTATSSLKHERTPADKDDDGARAASALSHRTVSANKSFLKPRTFRPATPAPTTAVAQQPTAAPTKTNSLIQQPRTEGKQTPVHHKSKYALLEEKLLNPTPGEIQELYDRIRGYAEQDRSKKEKEKEREKKEEKETDPEFVKLSDLHHVSKEKRQKMFRECRARHQRLLAEKTALRDSMLAASEQRLAAAEHERSTRLRRKQGEKWLAVIFVVFHAHIRNFQRIQHVLFRRRLRSTKTTKGVRIIREKLMPNIALGLRLRKSVALRVVRRLVFGKDYNVATASIYDPHFVSAVRANRTFLRRKPYIYRLKVKVAGNAIALIRSVILHAQGTNPIVRNWCALKHRVVFLQRTVRLFLAKREAQMLSLTRQWLRVEARMISEGKGKGVVGFGMSMAGQNDNSDDSTIDWKQMRSDIIRAGKMENLTQEREEFMMNRSTAHMTILRHDLQWINSKDGFKLPLSQLRDLCELRGLVVPLRVTAAIRNQLLRDELIKRNRKHTKMLMAWQALESERLQELISKRQIDNAKRVFNNEEQLPEDAETMKMELSRLAPRFKTLLSELDVRKMIRKGHFLWAQQDQFPKWKPQN